MTLTKAKARALTDSIKLSAQELEENIKAFYAGKGWVALGYVSFVEWYDEEIRDWCQITPKIRNWVIVKMVDDAPVGVGGRKERGTYETVADATGTSYSTVANVAWQARRKARNINEEETCGLSVVVPWRWRDMMIHTAAEKNINMSDIIRHCLKTGMSRHYKVDLDGPAL